LVGLLSGCANGVIIDPNPDGGRRSDGGDGGGSGASYWVATPATVSVVTTEGFTADSHRQWKRDPHYYSDGTTQYLFLSGSAINKESWSVSYFTQAATGTLSNQSNWTLALTGTAGTWYSGDITGPSLGSAKTLYFAANVDPTNPNPTRPDYVFEIGRATFDGVSYKAAATPALSVPTFTGSTANDTPTTARPDAYGVMDPWILNDGNTTNVTMYYAGLDCSTGTCKFQIFRTVSTDGGVTFPPGSVVLSGRAGVADEAGGVAGPSVIVRNGQYILAYTAVKTAPSKNRVSIRSALTTGTVGVAVSTDGISFTNNSFDGSSVITRVGGNYHTEGASSPTLYMDVTNAVHSYFCGYHNESDGESYNLATAEWAQMTK
jgi:hypothetical protein